MARSPEWSKLVMAGGDPKPAFPLLSLTPKFATWSIGGGRPFGCADGKCERWHAGIDLTGAPDGSVIVSPEDALVVGIDKGWSAGSKAAFLRTDSGLFVVLGGFKAGSQKEFGITTGQRVHKGEKLGRVLGSYGMIHLETYDAATRTANSVWWAGEGPPVGLLNPTNYVERMVGTKITLVQTKQRLEALKRLGFFAGDVNSAWDQTSTDALKAAQKSLAIAVDGKWGPATEDAIQGALAKLAGCSGDECAEPAPDDAKPAPAVGAWAALSPVSRVAAGVAIGSVALAAAAAVWRRL